MCVEVWLGGGRAGEGSARLSLSLSGCSLACRSHQLHICMCKKAQCWSAAASPPAASVCGRPVSDLFKCLWKRLILRTDMLFRRVTRGFFQPPGLFPGEISVQGGVRKWHAGHSCLSRFLPSMFVFLFPYPDSIWMELNLEPGGWFWRSFLGVPVHKRSPERLKLGEGLKTRSVAVCLSSVSRHESFDYTVFERGAYVSSN